MYDIIRLEGDKTENILEDVLKVAHENVSMPELLDFTLEKGKLLAKHYNANETLVGIGICLMDIKLKEALELGKPSEHIKLSLDFAANFLKDYNLTDEEKEIIYNCIEAHYGTVPYSSIEAEICANADAYIFIHPEGVFRYLSLLVKRGKSLDEQIAQLSNKLEEKHNILSLDYVKDELEPYYEMFKKMYSEIKK